MDNGLSQNIQLPTPVGHLGLNMYTCTLKLYISAVYSFIIYTSIYYMTNYLFVDYFVFLFVHSA